MAEAQNPLMSEYLQKGVLNTEWDSLDAASLPEAKPRDAQAERKPLLSEKKKILSPFCCGFYAKTKKNSFLFLAFHRLNMKTVPQNSWENQHLIKTF